MAERFTMFAEPTHVGALKRLHLLRAADRAEAVRRIVIAVLIGWLPLAVLGTTEALFAHRSAPLGVFTDFAMYAQLVVAVPLLIACEYIMLPALGEIGLHFSTSSVIPAPEHARFGALVARARSLQGWLRQLPRSARCRTQPLQRAALAGGVAGRLSGADHQRLHGAGLRLAAGRAGGGRRRHASQTRNRSRTRVGNALAHALGARAGVRIMP